MVCSSLCLLEFNFVFKLKERGNRAPSVRGGGVQGPPTSLSFPWEGETAASVLAWAICGYECLGAAVTSTTDWGASNSRSLFSHSFGGQKSEIKVSPGRWLPLKVWGQSLPCFFQLLGAPPFLSV